MTTGRRTGSHAAPDHIVARACRHVCIEKWQLSHPSIVPALLAPKHLMQQLDATSGPSRHQAQRSSRSTTHQAFAITQLQNGTHCTSHAANPTQTSHSPRSTTSQAPVGARLYTAYARSCGQTAEMDRPEAEQASTGRPGWSSAAMASRGLEARLQERE